MAKALEDKFLKFLANYPLREYPKGQILIFADEQPEHVYYILTGGVRQYDVSYRGDEVIVNIFKPKSFFPMSWAINQSQNRFFYKTEAETQIYIIPPNDILNYLKANPEVVYDLLARVFRGLDGILGRMVQLMSGTAKSRLIYELLIECQRFGKPDKSGGYSLLLNESDLAARTGLSRETISREIQKLKKSGWIKVISKSIIINDISALEQALGADVD